MINLLTNLKYEYNFIRFSKIHWILIITIIGVFLINHNNEINDLNSLNQIYQSTIQEATANGENVDELLEKEYTMNEIVHEDGTIIHEIENIIRYDYEKLHEQINAVHPNNLIIALLSNTALVFLPIIAGVLGIFIAVYDFINSTLKTRSLVGNEKNVYFSKLIMTILSFTVAFFIGLFISVMISRIWSSIALNSFSNLGVIEQTPMKEILSAIVVTFSISIFFLIVAFNLGVILKRMSLALVIFLIYHLIIPNLGKLDIKNLIFNLYNFSFAFDLSFNTATYISISLTLTIVILLLITIFSIVAGYSRLFYMSKYTI